MSQAIIDFCQDLQATLLGIEDRLAKARQSVDSAGAAVAQQTQEHIDTATRQLADFRVKASDIAAKLRADMPENSGEWKERLTQLSLEAQVALRHATIFLAEATAQGATGASALLQKGAGHAHAVAQHLRDDTAVVVREGSKHDAPSN